MTLLAGDCLDIMPTLDAESIDAIVTDPPYGLEFMGKEWDRLDGEAWRAGGGFSKPGIGQRDTAWVSFGAGDTANATCAICGGRMRGARKCACEAPVWMVKGKPLAAAGVDSRQAQSRKMQDWHYRWAVEALRVAKPGAHLLAFGGTRTYHRLACAIEDAGWEVRDCLVWAYASGFPKSLDVSKAMDKAAGATRRAGGVSSTSCPDFPAPCSGHVGNGRYAPTVHALPTLPSTPDARKWQGWGTALKPAWEPIILARKPLRGTVAANVAEYGTGALNIDGCRIPFESSSDAAAAAAAAVGYARSMELGTMSEPTSLPTNYAKPPYLPDELAGRWPANLILTDPIFDGGVEGVVGGGRSGGAAAPASGPTQTGPSQGVALGRFNGLDRDPAFYGDSGTYSRFFQLQEGDGCYLCGRARSADESSSPRRSSVASAPDPAPTGASRDSATTTDSPTTSATAMPFWPDADVSTPSIPRGRQRATSPASERPSGPARSPAANGTATDTTTTTGDRWTCATCADLITSDSTSVYHAPGDTRFLLIPKASRSDREPVAGGPEVRYEHSGPRGHVLNGDGTPRQSPRPRANHHPTVKPVALMRHLVRLVTPPGGIVLDPFLGSGTTALACEMEGFRWVGIEKEPEYAAIVEARLALVQLGLGLDDGRPPRSPDELLPARPATGASDRPGVGSLGSSGSPSASGAGAGRSTPEDMP